MVGIDLFAGAGGMALGAIEAGIDVRLAIESDPHSAETYARNHPGVRLLVRDIRNIDEIDIGEKFNRTIVFGGPPCQGFSTSNQRTRDYANPSNWLFLEFIRVINLCKPEWVVIENVKGISETKQGFFLKNIIDRLSSCGYAISWWVLNAADFGVPQRRHRLFLVGSLKGLKLDKPDPTISKYITVNEALSDLPELQNGSSVNWRPYKYEPLSEYAVEMRGNLDKSANHLVTRNAPYVIERYMHIPQGGNWQSIPAKLMRNYSNLDKCHTGIYHRLRENAPSLVIGNFRKNMLIHPNEHRGLSVREAARLQSFPDWYEFKGSIGFQQQQVGNAVPPLLAKAVFQAIIRNNYN